MKITIEGVRDTPEIEDVINTFPARDLAVVGTEPRQSRRRHKPRDSRRVCPICGEMFLPAPEHMYKIECPNRLLHILAPGKTANANKWVYFCRYDCWRKAQRMVEETGTRKLVCPLCGTEFRTKDERRVYCSVACSNQAWNVRDRRSRKS